MAPRAATTVPTRPAPADREKPAPEAAGPTVPLPAYEVTELAIPDEVGGVTVRALASGDLTESNLRALLAELRQAAGAEREKRGDRRDRVVAIFVYTDRARLEDGLKWVARLLVRPGEVPQAEVNRELLAIRGQPPEVKFGLTEAKRQEVFCELVWVQDWVVRQTLRPGEQDAVMERYTGALAGKHKLTRGQLDQVRDEGFAKQWAIPDVPPKGWKPPQPAPPPKKK